MKLIATSLLALLLLAAAPALQAQETKPLKVGYTNVELLLAYMPETKAIEKEIQLLESKLIASLEIKQKNYQIEVDDYTAKVQANLLSPDQQKTEGERIMNLQREIQNDLQKADQQVMERRLALLDPLQTKIQNAIDAVAKEGGYTYILNQVIGSGVPTIIYGAENMEVTDEIAKKLGIAVPAEEPAGQ